MGQLICSHYYSTYVATCILYDIMSVESHPQLSIHYVWQASGYVCLHCGHLLVEEVSVCIFTDVKSEMC